MSRTPDRVWIRSRMSHWDRTLTGSEYVPECSTGTESWSGLDPFQNVPLGQNPDQVWIRSRMFHWDRTLIRVGSVADLAEHWRERESACRRETGPLWAHSPAINTPSRDSSITHVIQHLTLGPEQRTEHAGGAAGSGPHLPQNRTRCGPETAVIRGRDLFCREVVFYIFHTFTHHAMTARGGSGASEGQSHSCITPNCSRLYRKYVPHLGQICATSGPTPGPNMCHIWATPGLTVSQFWSKEVLFFSVLFSVVFAFSFSHCSFG